jgi:hypothetical protein
MASSHISDDSSDSERLVIDIPDEDDLYDDLDFGEPDFNPLSNAQIDEMLGWSKPLSVPRDSDMAQPIPSTSHNPPNKAPSQPDPSAMDTDPQPDTGASTIPQLLTVRTLNPSPPQYVDVRFFARQIEGSPLFVGSFQTPYLPGSFKSRYLYIEFIAQARALLMTVSPFNIISRHMTFGLRCPTFSFLADRFDLYTVQTKNIPKPSDPHIPEPITYDGTTITVSMNAIIDAFPKTSLKELTSVKNKRLMKRKIFCKPKQKPSDDNNKENNPPNKRRRIHFKKD